jgi:aminoglycoside/choline kinase family phosphotransferase
VNQLIGSKLPGVVQACEVAFLGEGVGIMASIARASLTFEDGSRGSLIHKCAAQNENKVAAQGLDFYANEINFYRHLAASSPLRSPHCLYAELDPDTYDFLLVLEDLGDTEAGDQLAGCTREEILSVFTSAAQLHAHYWGKTDAISWLHPHNVKEISEFKRDVIFVPGVEKTIEMFPELFNEDLEEIVRKSAQQFVELFDATMQGPLTLVHGDYRVDNLFFMRHPELEILAVDWQNCGVAKGPTDVCYFISQGCDPVLRREIEMEALSLYHDTLVKEGVKDFSFDECLRDYRMCMLTSLITPIAVCGTLDSGNKRGMEMGKIMLIRNLAAIEDLGCAEFLE